MYNPKKAKVTISVFLILVLLGINVQAETEVVNKGKGVQFTGFYEEKEAYEMLKITKDYKLMAENDKIELYVNDDTLGLRFRNKKTGYIWSSDLDNYEDERLNDQWRNYVASGITIEYYEVKEKTMDYKVRQESVTTSRKTKVNVEKTDKGFKAMVVFDKSDITLSYNVDLLENGFSIRLDSSDIIEKIPKEPDKDALIQIKENPKKIVSVTLYPFLGSVKTGQQNGYFFIPDGDGALVNFEKQYDNLSSGYNKPYFGDDFTISGVNSSEGFARNVIPSKLLFPLYGVVHGVGHDGFMMETVSGASNSSLLMNPAGVRTEFYYLTNRYEFRTPYLHQITTEENSYIMPTEMDHFRIQENFYLLTDEMANYNGIAKLYRKNLNKKNLLMEARKKDTTDIPLHMQTFMSSMKRGIFFNRTVKMTTIKELESILSRLNQSGVSNVVASLDGLFKDVVTVNAKDRVKVNRSVGNSREIKTFIESQKEVGNHIAVNMDYQWFPYGGYGEVDMDKDMMHYRNGNFIFTKDKIGVKSIVSYYSNYNGAIKTFEKDMDKLTDMGISNMNMTLPYSGDNKNTSGLNRDESSDAIRKYFSNIAEDYYFILHADQGTEDNLAFATKVTDVKMATSLYPYVTDTVPFTALVYRDRIDMFSETLNTSGDPETLKLKMVEWGVYPNFLVTNDATSKLLYTSNWKIVSSEFNKWEKEIHSVYNFVNQGLNKVIGQEMTQHEVVADGIVKVSYKNGYKILINYTSENIKIDNQIVSSMAYKVVNP